MLAQTAFCKHTFTNKYWALCLEQKIHRDQPTESCLPLSAIQQAACLQASPGKIPIGTCLTWLLKAYFTLYWPTSLHFLSLHTSIPFLFPSWLLYLTASPPPSLPCFSWANKKRTGLFFLLCWVITVQHLHTHSLSYPDKHVWNCVESTEVKVRGNVMQLA